MSTLTTLTHKIQNLYVAYAPEFDVCTYGDCQDEALNNLTDELHLRQGSGGQVRGRGVARPESTGYEKNKLTSNARV